MNVVYNTDCMAYMRELPDNAFDLAVCDPPYGDACSQSVNAERERERGRHRQNKNCRQPDGTWGYAKWRQVEPFRAEVRPLQETNGVEFDKKIIAWDVAPGEDYFKELFRVSKHQIIWGANYFKLPPTRCFLVWRKLTISDKFSMAMCEYAWTSFNSNAKLFEFPPQGKAGDRFHPTQKPIELYKWIYGLYAKPGMKILDTHLGSGSSRIAAWDMGLDFVGTEIDPDYFRMQEERFKRHIAQPRLEQVIQQAEQETLF